MSVPLKLFELLVFPGFIFISILSFIYEWFDRKVVAKLQNRVGPPWFQPIADFIKLLAKEELVPRVVDKAVFSAAPLFATTAAMTAFLSIPVYKAEAVFTYPIDLIGVLYLLLIPCIALFLAGYASVSGFTVVGAFRTLTQLFGYEVPLFIACFGPAIAAGSLSISDIVKWQASHGALILTQPIGFAVALLALQGKLERIPFDIPEAETEIVAGHLTEYSGRRLAFFRFCHDVELVVGSALIASLWLSGANSFFGIPGFIMFLIKTTIIVFILANLRALFARLIIHQMVRFAWKYLLPLSILQIAIVLFVR